MLDKKAKKCGVALEITIFQGGRRDGESSQKRQKRIISRHL